MVVNTKWRIYMILSTSHLIIVGIQYFLIFSSFHPWFLSWTDLWSFLLILGENLHQDSSHLFNLFEVWRKSCVYSELCSKIFFLSLFPSFVILMGNPLPPLFFFCWARKIFVTTVKVLVLYASGPGLVPDIPYSLLNTIKSAE